MGPVIGGCLIAYGSEWGAAFNPRPNREEAAIFGVIAMLEAMGGGSGSMDMGALTGGLAFSLITILYGLVFAFTLFLPWQYYFQHELGKDS